jgi:protoheme IX farnesyltransferase
MIKTYYMLTKPGIIMGNLITTVGGFALASKGHMNVLLLLYAFVGLGLVIASACICNNVIDRRADIKMARTKNRPLAQGLISVTNAAIFAISLGILGTLILFFYTNTLTTLMAVAGFFFYVVMYSIWKYRSSAGTLVGSISGALPPVIGYCAVSGRLDFCALLLFAVMVLWQMPHFYAIASFRVEDYTAAAIPVLPVVKGMHVTKMHMLIYTVAFGLITASFFLFKYTGYLYLISTSLLSIGWLALCIKGFWAKDDKRWARHMFYLSLVIILVLSAMISLDTV